MPYNRSRRFHRIRVCHRPADQINRRLEAWDGSPILFGLGSGTLDCLDLREQWCAVGHGHGLVPFVRCAEVLTQL
jgi:hypothetical protein